MFTPKRRAGMGTAAIAALCLCGPALAQTASPTITGPAITLPRAGGQISPLAASPSTDAPRQPEGALDCAIKPSRIVEVSAAIDGVLAEVFVRPGQAVQAGDLIARIDTDIAVAELANAKTRADAIGALKMAEARVHAAQVQYSAQKRGYEARVVSKVDFERARGELLVAQQEVRREREAITVAGSDQERMALIVTKGDVRAPFDGVIGEELLNPTEAIQGRPIAQLIVTSPMRVEVFAPLSAAEAIRAGADFVLTTRPDDPIIAEPTLDYISPLADSSSQTIRVYYHLAHAEIAPGYRCFLSSRASAEAFQATMQNRDPAVEATQ